MQQHYDRRKWGWCACFTFRLKKEKVKKLPKIFWISSLRKPCFFFFFLQTCIWWIILIKKRQEGRRILSLTQFLMQNRWFSQRPWGGIWWWNALSMYYKDFLLRADPTTRVDIAGKRGISQQFGIYMLLELWDHYLKSFWGKRFNEAASVE